MTAMRRNRLGVTVWVNIELRRQVERDVNKHESVTINKRESVARHESSFTRQVKLAWYLLSELPRQLTFHHYQA